MASSTYLFIVHLSIICNRDFRYREGRYSLFILQRRSAAPAEKGEEPRGEVRVYKGGESTLQAKACILYACVLLSQAPSGGQRVAASGGRAVKYLVPPLHGAPSSEEGQQL